MKDTLPNRARLGAFDFDLKAGELQRDGQTILLQEQPAQVLRMLLAGGGELVTREEIQKKLWPNDTVVEFDHGINTAIQKLRQALGDSADKPSYIQTVARRGYRLVVAVEWIAAAKDSPANVVAQVTGAAGAAVRIQPDPGALTGRTVSHYRVLDVIGGGGMGVVYRAEDLKLGRAVALKFLPEELGSDPQALERFSREARAASSLDHPNICPIFEFGEHEGRSFMVMQLLAGQTLRDRLAAREGALPLEELLDIGIQVSDGLQAAHEQGIIHRDIKPANIFITNRGACKILDFGLAKLLEMGGDEQSAATPVQAEARDDLKGDAFRRAEQKPSLISSGPRSAADPHLTRTGSAMGTAGYMSPEQVRGGKLDARTDLFSFGLVLYEMATGQKAFSGETAEVVHQAILHQPKVPVHDLDSELPPELETTIDKALEKDRERRYQSAAEMRDDLKRLHGAELSLQKPRRYGRILLFAAVLAIALLVLGWERHWFKVQQTAPGRMLSERLLTHAPSENRVMYAAISPDGRYVAYTDPKGLHLSVIETGEIHDVPLPEELRPHLWGVTWFPDGEKLLFTADSDTERDVIWVTSVFGGAPRKLGSSSHWPGPVASPQGSSIAFVNGGDHGIWVMGANGENPHRVLSGGDATYAALAWSPTGQRLAYVKATSRLGGSIETVSLEGGSPTVVISDPQMRISNAPGMLWLHDGHIIFVKSEGPLQDAGNLWEIMANPRTGEASGRATKITNWDGLATSPSVSGDARRLAVVKTHVRDDVYVGELEAGGTLAFPTRLTVSESTDFPSGWTRDRKTILFSSNRTGRRQIFRQQMDQDSAEPWIRGADEEDGAKLSPDGRWIFYWSAAPFGDSPPTTKSLMRFPVLVGSPKQILEARMDHDFDCPLHPDSSCVLSHWEQGQLIFYALDPVQGQGKELGRTKLGYPPDLQWSLSPEGSRISLASRDQLPEQVRILDFRNGTERNLPVPHGWRIWSLSWTADGNALFAAVVSTTGYLIARIELNGKTRVLLLDQERNHWMSFLCPSPDGHRLAFSQRTFESNVWLLENF